MATEAAILAVHLLDAQRGPVKAGTLARDAGGAVVFSVDEIYLHDANRPILSLGWYDPSSEEGARDRLVSRRDKIALHG